MKKILKKLFYIGSCFLVVCLILTGMAIGCASHKKTETEARVRHYFALNSNEPLTASVIESTLRSRFPIGTPVNKFETWLAGQGFGEDGYSISWQTNQCIAYEVYDYSDAFFSMRHIQVTASYDGEQKIQVIQADVYSYSL